MNFRLTNKPKNISKEKKRIRNGFNTDISDSEEDDASSELIKSAQAKARKISAELPVTLDKEIFDALENDSDQVEKKKPKDVGHSKYVANLRKSKLQREKDQLLSKFKVQESMIDKASNANSFESKAYKKQRLELEKLEAIEKQKNKEAGSTRFYLNLIDGKKSQESKIPGIQQDQSDKTLEEIRKIQEEVHKSEIEIKPKSNVHEEFVSTPKYNYEVFIKSKLREITQCKLSQNQILEYKKRYWERYNSTGG